MTRLAEALKRAETEQTTAEPPVLAAPRPVPVDVRPPRLDPPSPPEPRSVAGVPPPARPSARTTAASPLIVFPQEPRSTSAWRRDPDVTGKLVGTEGFPAPALEQYRRLATALHRAQESRGTRVVMSASALPGEGKTLTLVNLALTLSESLARRVLLIDADLRRPTVQRLFGLPTLTGLCAALKADEDTPLAIEDVTERLAVLPAGRPDPDPLSGLASERMRRLVAHARDTFDWVLIDTPALSLLPDARLLADCTDGALLVIRSGMAPYPLVRRVVETIGHDGILGVVMNAIDRAHDSEAGRYYEYYGYTGAK